MCHLDPKNKCGQPYGTGYDDMLAVYRIRTLIQYRWRKRAYTLEENTTISSEKKQPHPIRQRKVLLCYSCECTCMWVWLSHVWMIMKTGILRGPWFIRRAVIYRRVGRKACLLLFIYWDYFVTPQLYVINIT